MGLSSAIVWIWKVPQVPCVKSLVISLELLEGGGTFKRWEVLGHWVCPLEGDCRKVVFPPLSLVSGCHETGSFLCHMLLPYCAASAQAPKSQDQLMIGGNL
jgi:hypothetical protein